MQYKPDWVHRPNPEDQINRNPDEQKDGRMTEYVETRTTENDLMTKNVITLMYSLFHCNSSIYIPIVGTCYAFIWLQSSIEILSTF